MNPLRASLLATVLCLPALWGGWTADDLLHKAKLTGALEPFRPGSTTLELFTFMPGPPHNAGQMDLGMLPWWSLPDIRVAFLRPLSTLTHQLDYALWPDHGPLQHLHSLLWFALGVFLVCKLYTRLQDAGAPLACLLFAVEDAHAFPAGWLANRNAAICLVGGMLALHLHLRGRRLALAVFAVSLFAGEAALGVLAYIAAWELVHRRWKPLVPYVGVVVVWRAVYNALDFGARGSGLYVDPGASPLGFVAAVAERLPVLMSGQWLQLPVDVWLLLPRSGQLAMTGVGLVVVAALALGFRRVVLESVVARFYALGMTLSLVPLCGAFPMDRLLLFTGIGAFGLLSMAPWKPLVALHALGVVLLPARTVLVSKMMAIITMATMENLPGDLGGKHLFLARGIEFQSAYIPVIRAVEGDPPAASVAVLDTPSADAIWTRVDERTLSMRHDGGMLSHPVDHLCRDNTPFRLDETVTLPGVVVQVVQLTEDGRPAEVIFRFHQPLEHPDHVWLMFDERGRFVPFPLPEVGQPITTPAFNPLAALRAAGEK